jgi:hypothetical protein
VPSLQGGTELAVSYGERSTEKAARGSKKASPTPARIGSRTSDSLLLRTKWQGSMSQKEIEVSVARHLASYLAMPLPIMDLKGGEIMSNVRTEGRKDLTPTPDPSMAQGSLQRIQHYLVRRRQRELLERARRRLATETSEPGEKELFARCPKCGEALGRL